MSNHMDRLNSQLGNNKQRKQAKNARRAKPKAPKAKPQPIRVRFDHRTTATIQPHMLEFWRGRDPNLTIITTP